MLSTLFLLTEVITSTLSGSYRYNIMGYQELNSVEFHTENRVVIAVVDSGIPATTYEYLRERVTLKQDTSTNVIRPQGVDDRETHGDMVVRSMVDSDTELPGTCFISTCHVYLYKAMTNSFSTSHSIGIALLLACTNKDVDIVNLSISSIGVNTLTENAIRLCALTDKLVVVSAGNNGFIGRVTHPCSSLWTLCVGGITSSGSRNPISNVSSKVKVYAPSEGYSLANNMNGSGTSGASALVAGVAALVLSQNNTLTSRELSAIIVNSAQLNHNGLNVVNVAEALKMGSKR